MNSKRFLTFGMRIGLPLAVAGMTFAAVAQAENWTLQGSNIYNNNSGNVGIGMSNPNRKLNVYNSTVDAVSPLTLSEFD